MFPFNMKRFIQGPNLHEESVARNSADLNVNVPSSHPLSGEEAKKVYEEIVSSSSEARQPASSNSVKPPTSTSLSPIREKQRRQIPPKQCSPPLKSINQLMTLCESNLHSELHTYILSQCSNSKFNINEQDIYGWSLLMSAACAGANDCLRILLKNGASTSLKDKKGLRATDLARNKKRYETVAILNEWNQLYGDAGVVLMDLEDDDETAASNTIPVFCEACNQSFTNQNAHLKSIAHLFSSGVFQSPEGKIHYGIPESNRGFQLMLKKGWDQSSGLGPDGQGNKFPIKTVLKRDRQGVGNQRDKKGARITHFAPFDVAAVEGPSRIERVATVEKKAQFKRKTRETRKEIHYRRQLNLL